MAEVKLRMFESNAPEKQELPDGWARATLDRLLVLMESGSRPRGGVREIQEGIPSIGAEHLNSEGGFRLERLKFVPESYYKTMRRGHLAQGDVLVVKDGATTGKVSLVRSDFPYKKAVVNEHIFICRPAPGINAHFLFWYLFSREGQEEILANFQGSAQGGINQTFAAGTTVRVAPTAEEQRIVAKIETLLARVNAGREMLAKLPAILKRLRQSVLAAACSGRLTADWREAHPDVEPSSQLLQSIHEVQRQQAMKRFARTTSKDSTAVGNDFAEQPELPETWCWTTIGEVAELVTDGDHNPPRRVPKGVPHLTAKHIKNWRIVSQDSTFVSEQDFEKSRARYDPKAGDLLITCVGTIGATAIVPRRFQFSADRNLAAIRMPPTQILSDVVQYVLNSYPWTKWIANASGYSAQPHLYLGDLRSIPIPLIPIAEQREIVQRVDAMLKLVDAIEKRGQAGTAIADKLTQSILAKAFRGELVPQDPNDEPATVLLERIHADRAAAEQSSSLKLRGGAGSEKTSQKAEVLMLTRRDIHSTHLTDILKEHGPLTAEALWSASQLDIDQFYDQLKDEESHGLLRENRSDSPSKPRTLQAA
jgi:type I restriction enzyme S subunit